MFIAEIYGRCVDCNYAVDVESVSMTSVSSRIGTALLQHAVKNPTHTIKVFSRKPQCSVSEHLDAAVSAVACKCQCKCGNCVVAT